MREKGSDIWMVAELLNGSGVQSARKALEQV